MKAIILMSFLFASHSFALTTMNCQTQLKTTAQGIGQISILEAIAPQLDFSSPGAILATRVAKIGSTSTRPINLDVSKLPQGITLGLSGKIENFEIQQEMKVTVNIRSLNPSAIQIEMMDAISKEAYKVNLDPASDSGSTMSLFNQKGLKLDLTCGMR